ncbi:small nuclear RNA activating complex (SNAPc), subunit SNAP43 protein [Artemisia annua]|uniref:Small nuclear RNA activating complex (SNAPc), subunit SNAP43 protein n=1 Tax=Artemisia annua TaxID=35608 RepID=A0A2U1NHF7_ARTAN|nr:small nuclear RNA activating complex (SNAPc), subunit SNAP43 protein [Artemisia annua]
MDLNPFRLDIDGLINDFAEGEMTSFTDMKTIWLSKKFSSYIAFLFAGQLKRLKELVIDAKKEKVGVVPVLVNTMLDRNLFLFGAVDLKEGLAEERVNELIDVQNAHVQHANKSSFAKHIHGTNFMCGLWRHLEKHKKYHLIEGVARSDEITILDFLIKYEESQENVDRVKIVACDSKLLCSETWCLGSADYASRPEPGFPLQPINTPIVGKTTHATAIPPSAQSHGLVQPTNPIPTAQHTFGSFNSTQFGQSGSAAVRGARPSCRMLLVSRLYSY